MSTVSSLESCIRAFQSNPENDTARRKYINELSKLHEKIYPKSTDFFGGNGFYLRSIYRIANHPKISPEIAPLAQDVINKEKSLYNALFHNENQIEDFYKDFSKSYEKFSNSYHEIIIKKFIPNSSHAKQCQDLKPVSDSEKSTKNLSWNKDKSRTQQTNSLHNEIEMQVF